ncbi:MAG: D-alanyl-D-alanine carboxypeptidase [Holophagae bacterium]|jgi:D-alanyl-D-alanine carboxypeptidase/D-alanyl-D-alanine-endopeptidase (penicillin-binding protein 4)
MRVDPTFLRAPLTAAVCVAALCLPAASAIAADRDRLFFHAETLSGEVLASQGADLPFNPASLIKVGTTLWALETLGSEARYETVFGVEGEIDGTGERAVSSLVVLGGGDPDFQPENLFMVARRLNDLGITRVNGPLRIEGRFWIGWENGHENAVVDETKRAERMGRRMRMMLDPSRWDRSTRAAWTALCERRGWPTSRPPKIVVVGSVEAGAARNWTTLVVHRSNPLHVLLRRFNVYSNNDIIRIAEGLGGTSGLQSFLEKRLGEPTPIIELATASGERRNRLTARTGVRLLRAFLETAADTGLAPSDLLPVTGCDPGSTDRKFPALARGSRAGTVALKTGTLIETDGGVAVLGGIYTTLEREQVLFCVAATETGRNELHWRSLQQSWLMELMVSSGGAVQRPCGEELPFSDTYAEIEHLEPAGKDIGS